VIRACRELGVETVAIYSQADRDAPYLQLADEAICVGPAKAADSYLRIDRVISAAEIGNVQAIHPGYGFLSENAHFAEVCRSCDIGFIGPTPEAMARVGDKNSARALAREAGVPCVPGSDGLISNEQEAVTIARQIGFPVLLKATAGGGGKGMRVAANDLALAAAWQQASAEAQAAFGNAGIYIERYIERPRHVEIQILGDQHGNVVHLWERDCSTQRRHQKLIEESPSPRLPAETRARMCEAAVRLARAAGYYSAGTVEFIVDQQDNFYFIEVNARIQVEHPVSELVTGIDLVKAQIHVAAGERLSLSQADIVPRGHAIECRINAEDPAANFRPCPGRIDRIIAPGGFGVRWDSHATTGYVVPPHYD
jgi:acetyl-CoA carboxylase biotin carboxylase subunit